MVDFSVNWANVYPGIDYACGVNQDWVNNGNPDNNANNVNILRIDLNNPKVSLVVSPFEFLNKTGNKTTDFLSTHFDQNTVQAMYAINANFFDMLQRNIFYGLAVSDGNMISYPSPLIAPCTVYINKENAAIISICGAGIDSFTLVSGHVQPWTAVSGNCLLVTNGISSAPSPSSPLSRGSAIAARTAIGLSVPLPGNPPQYLYFLTIDGAEIKSYTLPPYYGATLQDVADWMIAAGAYNVIGLDGGGSTTMAKAITNGVNTDPSVTLINSPHDDETSSAVCERKVAVSFGVSILY